MAKLIYSAIASLDGYIADADGSFDWAAPDEEVHAFVNDLERPIGTYLYGRRMYEVMVAWETMPTDDDQPPVSRDYTQIWRAADKIVYSRTLPAVSSARTRQWFHSGSTPRLHKPNRLAVLGSMSRVKCAPPGEPSLTHSAMPVSEVSGVK